MKALYAKNGALCVVNGALVVGDESGEPTCVCGESAQPNACCAYQSTQPGLVLSYLPPSTPIAAPPFRMFGSIGGTVVYEERFERPSETRTASFSGVFNTPQNGGIPSAQTCALYHPIGTLVVTRTGVPTQTFNDFRNSLAPLFFGSPVVVFDPQSQANAPAHNVQTAFLGAGLTAASFPIFRHTSPLFQNPRQTPALIWNPSPSPQWNAVMSGTLTPMGSSMTSQATYRHDYVDGIGQRNVYEYSVTFSVTGLSQCALPTALTGCSNCPDANTGAAIL